MLGHVLRTEKELINFIRMSWVKASYENGIVYVYPGQDRWIENCLKPSLMFNVDVLKV